MNKDRYENLANAIISKAVSDYQEALIKSYIYRNNKNQNNKKIKQYMSTIRECEEFFRSDWFKRLRSIDSKKIIMLSREQLIDRVTLWVNEIEVSDDNI